MVLLHEGYDIGRAFGMTPVLCVMCNIKSALDCQYCGGSMVRMVPPGWTADDAVDLPPLRYQDLVIIPGDETRPDEGYMVCDERYANTERQLNASFSRKRSRERRETASIESESSGSESSDMETQGDKSEKRKTSSKRRKSDGEGPGLYTYPRE